MAETRDFLLEIGCEEMPSAPLMNAQRQLGELVRAGLGQAGLAFEGLETLSTPRRLAVVVRGLPTRTREVRESRRGPAASIAFDEGGSPTKAALGFARKNAVDAGDLVRRRDADGREYVFAERVSPSRQSAQILSELSEHVMASLEWPNYRSQRWGCEHQTFVRPVRWICALFGAEVVPVTYAGVTSGATTRGHRVMGAGEHEVKDPASYVETLRSCHVMGERERAQVIRAGIADVEAARDGARVDTPARVFDEVVNLCEWPHVLVGRFDEEFLAVPEEIISESMLSHQRYFPILDASGALTREFVVVSNADPACDDTVIDGNERVVRARLDDAKFFWEEDLKRPLEDYVSRLGTVVFQERLGTVLQKAERMEAVAPEVARAAGADADVVAHAARAARLAKADLVTQAVVEFTSQQGVMGGYYARAAGEPADVADAIREHYRPRFSGDALPTGVVGTAVAVADKLDTICGIFAIDEAPTGSKDPFAVRRAAIGVIALLRSLPPVSLRALISLSLDTYQSQGLPFDPEVALRAIVGFFQGRLATIAREDGVSVDVIEAVTAVGVIDPAEFLARAHALEDARSREPELFEDLAHAYTRAAHLADSSLAGEPDETTMGDAERALLGACRVGSASVRDALAAHDYEAACVALAELRRPIDRFFEDVLVMDKDTGIRENRLRLLNLFVSVFTGVADVGALSRAQ
ncbi:glycine--tRNA ligase subunit beta [Olsenella sp. HMSC062G07]|uniref:glycine--tRNA ligase subunit beta n=1 Tax=Olsenella sp. HMSC062G07 TaxID=1739330 RepID=UPI0008A3CEFF|nr:glycine--tRNA ligase subunit beta [Olsenella sp. HMSC062G07]OFK24293.1 glycine--tRNA ligase subunit beta [Olsenella sp. HMSC062G07]